MQILKEVDRKLIFNKEIPLKMVNIDRKDQELEEEIREPERPTGNKAGQQRIQTVSMIDINSKREWK
jgi:hypothetical protein